MARVVLAAAARVVPEAVPAGTAAPEAAVALVVLAVVPAAAARVVPEAVPADLAAPEAAVAQVVLAVVPAGAAVRAVRV